MVKDFKIENQEAKLQSNYRFISGMMPDGQITNLNEFNEKRIISCISSDVKNKKYVMMTYGTSNY